MKRLGLLSFAMGFGLFAGSILTLLLLSLLDRPREAKVVAPSARFAKCVNLPGEAWTW